MATTRLEQAVDPADDGTSIVFQGGAMRVSYSLGVCESLQRSAVWPTIGRAYTSSAGIIAAVGLLYTTDCHQFSERLFELLAGRRFIDEQRLRRIVDVDYLVDEAVLPNIDLGLLESSARRIYVTVTNARSGEPRYIELTPDNAPLLMKATMAIPVLYGKTIRLQGDRWVDGGISDPVPVLRAAQCEATRRIGAVINTPISAISDGPKRLHERLIVAADPRISVNVRLLMLGPGSTAHPTQAVLTRGQAGCVPVEVATPGGSGREFSRTCTDLAKLQEFRSRGSTHGLELARQLGTHVK